MVVIEFYLAFALATAFTALFGVFIPVMNEARKKGLSNTLIDSPILASIIFLGVTTVLAPFVVSSLIIPYHAELFRTGLQKAVEKPDN